MAERQQGGLERQIGADRETVVRHVGAVLDRRARLAQEHQETMFGRQIGRQREALRGYIRTVRSLSQYVIPLE